LALDEGG